MLDILALLIVTIVPVLILAELLTVLIYGIFFIWRISQRNGNIQKAKDQNDRIFGATAGTVIQACKPVEAVLRVFEYPQEL